MPLAPIVLFTYNRPWHTKQVLDALALNDEAKDSVLYIYCDGAKENASQENIDKIKELRTLVKSENRFNEVVVKEQIINKGLANSIIDGVTEIVNKYGSIIVLEDDIVPSKGFLKYMNDALFTYKADEEIMSIASYAYPIDGLPETFFIKCADCWGWATWKKGWDLFEINGEKLLTRIEEKKLTDEFDFNNSYPFTQMLKDQIAVKNNSWAIRWYASSFLCNKLTLYPHKTLVKNIGFDGSGTHCSDSNQFDNTLEDISINVKRIELKEDLFAKEKMSLYLKDQISSDFIVSNLPFNSDESFLNRNIKKIIPKKALFYYRKLFPNSL